MKPEPQDAEALKQLRELIASVDDLLKQQPPVGYEGNAKRARFIGIQISLGRFLGSIGCKEIERELFLLASALDDLDRGVVHPALEPKISPKGGRLPDLSETWLARAGMAAAAKCFLLADMDRKKAARLFNKAHAEMQRLVRKSKVLNLTDAPFNWLRDFEGGKITTPVGGGAWEENAEQIKNFKQSRPTEAEWIKLGKTFLNVACKQTARFGAGGQN